MPDGVGSDVRLRPAPSVRQEGPPGENRSFALDNLRQRPYIIS